ncbi:MAG: DUF3047 domain-containing protein, partial [Nitrospiraceae bacterium]
GILPPINLILLMFNPEDSCTIALMKTSISRRALRICLLGTIAAGFYLHFVSALAAAGEIPVLEFKENQSQAPPHGWELETHHGAAALTTVREDIGTALKLHADESSFSIQKYIEVDLRSTPWLVWQWKVTAVPEQGDFTKTERDDQCAQLILAFSKSVWEMQKAVSYIWGSTAPVGTMGDTAAGKLLPLLNLKAVVVRSGKQDMDKWITESRNVFEDYKQLYGKEPERVVGVRIQINSQHTKTQAESIWGRASFKSTP